MTSATVIPARYAKFITALLGAAIGYLTAYGPVWNLQGALVMAGTALAVLGVPNAAAPPVPVVTAPVLPPSGTVTVVPSDHPAGGINP